MLFKVVAAVVVISVAVGAVFIQAAEEVQILPSKPALFCRMSKE